MKKKGFTLVELLAVIAILAILVIVAMPNVIDMFNSAKADTFVTDVQKYIDTAKTSFVSDAFSNPAETIYYSSVDNPVLGTSKLDMDGNKDYFIEMDRHGEFKRIIIKDDNFCYDVYSDGSVIKFDNSNSKKVSKIEKSTVSVSDVWNSEIDDSIVVMQDGSNFKIKGCDAITTVNGKTNYDFVEDTPDVIPDVIPDDIPDDTPVVPVKNYIKIDGVDYEYDPGMTWNEWLNSSYSPYGTSISTYRDAVWLGEDTLRYNMEFCLFDKGYMYVWDEVTIHDEIIKNGVYIFNTVYELPAVGDCRVGKSYYDVKEPIKHDMQQKVYNGN